MTMHIPTPEELRARREALGIKQTELAKRAGISQSMVARIEAGNVDPRISTLFQDHSGSEQCRTPENTGNADHAYPGPVCPAPGCNYPGGRDL